MPAVTATGAVAGEAGSKGTNTFPQPKNPDKPRPHVCGTCRRPFARLEHLKRHERSHTKEKPFECPECQRCFARRDLLLRHQQKLHQTATPSKGRNRRESVASATPGVPSRVRKNSVAGSGSAGMRPRANTISHVDRPPVYIPETPSSVPRPTGHGHNRHPSLLGLPMQNDYAFGGMSVTMGSRGMPHGLPRLNTHGFQASDFSGGLRTAPVNGADFDFENLLFGPANTINPNALHYNDSPHAMETSPYTPHFPNVSAGQSLDENFDWLNGFEHQMSFNNNDQAVDESSPSAVSTASQSGMNEMMLDGSAHLMDATAALWQPPLAPQHLVNPFSLNLGHGNFKVPNATSIAARRLQHPHINNPYFVAPGAVVGAMSPPVGPALGHQQHAAFSTLPDAPGFENASIQYGAPASTVTESTRQALLGALCQGAGPGSRRQSFAAASSAGSPPLTNRAENMTNLSRDLPSTTNLQRYIRAYIRCFHPHLPFLHIPTLSFDVPAHNNAGRGHARSIGGRGCLILSMAAIGAVYEMEHAQSRDLFDSAKQLLQQYLEERRRTDGRTANEQHTSAEANSPAVETVVYTPIWLVQAMLLNVVYGHSIGDKTTADIASTHCAQLVSLAKAADLVKPRNSSQQTASEDMQMRDDGATNAKYETSPLPDVAEDQQDWYSWKGREERTRTLYAVFVMSSVLMLAYNHTPALTNSEIKLSLPCEEDLWAAPDAGSFYSRGGTKAAEQLVPTFHGALGELLRTGETQLAIQRGQQSGALGADGLPVSILQPSSFGCLILINALHNYIWETRQRHQTKVWKGEEMQKMHRHIEPALKAWQAAWSRNPNHNHHDPNAQSNLSVAIDSIPLADLAYVRLYVDLSRCKEKFWQRDYDGMAEELSRGFSALQHIDQSPSSGTDSEPSDMSASSSVFVDSPPTSNSSPKFNPNVMVQPNVMNPESNQVHPHVAAPSSRERHLREAATHAVESLSTADRLGVMFADVTARDLPLQSTMCIFDCAQVLAEWVTTMQERVGPFVGVLGRDQVDYAHVSGMMLLDERDFQVINKVQEMLNNAEMKMNYELAGMAAPLTCQQRPSNTENLGYGCKILRVTAHMFDRGAVWPVTQLMAASLEVQANHMKSRAENSINLGL